MRRANALLLAAMVGIPSPGSAQQAVIDALGSVDSAVVRLAHDRDTAAFWHAVGVRGTPLITPDREHPGYSLVTFVHREADSTADVSLDSYIASIDPAAEAVSRTTLPLERVPGTDAWVLTVRLRDDVRAPYRIAVRRSGASEPSAHLDPHNSTVWEPTQNDFRASILELPDAPRQPWREVDSARGEWHSVTIVAANESRHEVSVYLPAEWRDDPSREYPVVVGMGAFSIRTGMRVDRMVDHLLASGALPPLVVALVEVQNRTGSPRYEDVDPLVADLMLPVLRQRFHVSDRPEQVALAGMSRRGMMASLVALRRPDAVGNVISLSGSYYWRPDGETAWVWVPATYAVTPRRPIRLFVAAGLLETFVNRGNHGHYLVGTNRHFRDVLRAAGYEAHYVEFNGVHSELNWQDWLAAGMVHLFGRPP